MKFHFSNEIAKFLLTKELRKSIVELSDWFKKNKNRVWDDVIADQFLVIARKNKLNIRTGKFVMGSAKVFIYNQFTIVKIGGISELEESESLFVPKRSVPTIIAKPARILEDGGKDLVLIRVQPKVNVDSSSRWFAFSTLGNLRYTEVGADCHVGNVGMYKKKPVVFDW